MGEEVIVKLEEVVIAATYEEPVKPVKPALSWLISERLVWGRKF